jgi:hypothetical protein
MSDENKKQLSDWIDTDAIAQQILDLLEDEEVEPTLENAQQVWLDVLYTELGDGIRASIKALAEKSNVDVQLPEKVCRDGTIAVES